MRFSLFGPTATQLKDQGLGAVLHRLDALLQASGSPCQLAQPHAFQRQNRFYDLAVTLKIFLTQCLRPDHTCRTAVATAQDRGWLPETASPDTGAYCRARDGLCATGLAPAVRHTGAQLDALISSQDHWQGRRVRVVDGTGITLPDTPPNQQVYPQPSQQKPGWGFPVLKLVALMSLATGAILHYATGSLHDHDLRLFHRLRPWLEPGDIVLGDRAFGGFATLAVLVAQGVDAVVRRHQCRKTDWTQGMRLGKADSLVIWQATPRRPEWLAPEVTLPETLRVREVRFEVLRPGFRTKTITVVTTLLDAKRYPPKALAALYWRRWTIELWLRDIKTTMDMEVLRTPTPARVRADLAMFLLTYNLIRTVMYDAVHLATVALDRLSFQSTVVRFRLWWARASDPTLALSGMGRDKGLVHDLIRDRNLGRPGRIEPRVKKRRPKPFPLMTQPRQQLRQAWLSN
jgi:Transposase DDE domain